MVLKSSRCHFGKNQVSGFRQAPWFASSCGGHGRFPGRVHAINARRAKPAAKSLKGLHGTGHTLAISHAALAAYFNLKDGLAEILIVHDGDIAELKSPCLIPPQAGVDRE